MDYYWRHYDKTDESIYELIIYDSITIATITYYKHIDCFGAKSDYYKLNDIAVTVNSIDKAKELVIQKIINAAEVERCFHEDVVRFLESKED